MRRIAALAWMLSGLAVAGPGCSGSSGGGAATVNASPTLLSASFLGAGADPVAGDVLRLLLSDPVALASGATLDAADFDVVGGGLVLVGGARVVAPYLLEATLGAGAALTTGVSTLSFGSANDAVQDSDGNLAVAGTPRALRKADAEDPRLTALTLSGVDGSLNGTGVAGGTLQVASTGFTVDLAFVDASSAVDPDLVVVAADQTVFASGVGIPAGENLTPVLMRSVTTSTASFSVPTEVEFPEGEVRISAFVGDVSGRISAVESFRFLVRRLDAGIQPFETSVNPEQVWFLDTSRDLESLRVNVANQTTPVEVIAGPNGVSDLDDVMAVLGLRVAMPIPNVRSGLDSNQVVTERFRARVLAELAGFLTGVNVRFTFDSPGAFPNAEVVDYNSFGFSRMCIAGSATTGGNTGVAGLAIFDPHNRLHEDDCIADFSGDRLGVFVHTIVNRGYLSGVATSFDQTFGTFQPIRVNGAAGIPVGSHPDSRDGERLNDPTLDIRAGRIERAIVDLARVVAVITAHECGHSMGLVQNGAMPEGLFGNSAAFPNSTAGHIRMIVGGSSPFPVNSLNIMSPSLSYSGAIHPGTGFNSLNLAYLREEVIYNSDDQ